jgi:hypothetical protein
MPEDVQDVIDAGVDKLELWGELLASLGKQTGLGLEDSSLCCFVAWRFRRRPVVFEGEVIGITPDMATREPGRRFLRALDLLGRRTR